MDPKFIKWFDNIIIHLLDGKEYTLDDVIKLDLKKENIGLCSTNSKGTVALGQYISRYCKYNSINISKRQVNGTLFYKFKRSNTVGKRDIKGFTKEEDLLIVKNITLYPNNLKYAFEQTALRLNMDWTKIRNRYYTFIKDTYSNTITCGSKEGISNNVKNSKRDLINTPDDVPKQSLQPWLSVIHIYMDLPKEQQQALKVLIQTI